MSKDTHQQDRKRGGNAQGGMTGSKTAGSGTNATSGPLRGRGNPDEGPGREGVGDTDDGTAGMGRAR